MNSPITFLIIFLSFVSCNFKPNINVTYISVKKTTYISNRNVLKFNIENNSSDTLCISSNYIKIKVVDNGKILKEENPDELPFISLDNYQDINSLEEPEEILKKKFAIRIYKENYKTDIYSDGEKNWIIQGIMDKMIIILPKRSKYFYQVFYSSQFSNNSRVNVEYSNDGIFSVYVDDEGNERTIIFKT